jgi:hypothetical protein
MNKPGRGSGAVNIAVLIAPLAVALKLQRPLPHGSLRIVAPIEKPDAWPEGASGTPKLL